MYLECCLASTVKMVGVSYLNGYKNAMCSGLFSLDYKADPIRLKSWHRRYLILLQVFFRVKETKIKLTEFRKTS